MLPPHFWSKIIAIHTLRGYLDFQFPSPITLFPSLITQNWWVPRLSNMFGCVSSFCFHHSILWFLSDGLWKLKIHFKCFQAIKTQFPWHFRNKTHMHGTHYQCKVTPGAAFDNKSNGSLIQYHYTPSSTHVPPHELKPLLPALTFMHITILPVHLHSARSELNQPTSPCHDHSILHAPTKPISPTPFSAFFTKIWRYYLHLSCLYIWFVGNRVVFRIFYIESRIGHEVCFSLFFSFFSLFDVWVFAFDLFYFNSWGWVFNPWWWSLHLLHLGFQTHANLQTKKTSHLLFSHQPNNREKQRQSRVQAKI